MEYYEHYHHYDHNMNNIEEEAVQEYETSVYKHKGVYHITK